MSLTAKGVTTGEIAALFDDVHGATVSKDTISKITNKVIEEMTEWCNRTVGVGVSGGLRHLLSRQATYPGLGLTVTLSNMGF